MSEGEFPRLAEARVAIVGLGLIGGSLALALRPHCATLLGVDPDPQARSWGQHHARLDVVSADPAAVLPRAQVVLLAAPVSAILRLIPRLPQWVHGPALVMDVGSTKGAIATALAQLPPPLQAVGGHPMAGKALGGAEHAEATLFRDAPFALVALPNTGPAAHRLAQEVVAALGARPVWLDAAAHDEAVAAVSHLPYLLALALALATPEEAAVLLGPGFRSTSRLGGSPPELMADILGHNLPAVRRALARLRRSLDALEAALDDPTARLALFTQGQQAHARLLARARREGAPPTSDSS